MSNSGRRTGLWGKLARGLFEFDAPLTANLLPLLPDTTTRTRREPRPAPRPPSAVTTAAPDEPLDIDVHEEPADITPGERAALVVVHGSAPGERFDLGPGTVSLGPDDDVLLSCDDDGVTLRAHGSTADVHVDFQRVGEARLSHGDLVGIGGTLLKFLRAHDIEAAHFDELYRLHRFDGLTDIYHERYLRNRLWSALSHARRHASPLALAVLDLAPRTVRGATITGLAHDLVLREVARAARNAAGDDEVLGRHGPHQLALVLPDRDLQTAAPRVEALRAAVAAAPVTIDGQRALPRPSIGLAALTRGMLLHEDLLRAALAALPRA